MQNVLSPAIPSGGSKQVVLQRHPELYFDNGDVVLQAKLRSDGDDKIFQLYCVHKAILSFHSVVFCNLFADGSAGPEQSYDGRPLVDMPDEADDLSHLLSYVYKPSKYLLRVSHPDTALELRGAAKLAGKYILENARSEMIAKVQLDWPTTLDDWDLQDSVRQQRSHMVHNSYRPGASRFLLRDSGRPLDPVSAILFAQEHGCTDILPAAFYRLASVEISDNWHAGPQNHMRPCARWSLCDKDNLVRWIKGRKALEDYHRRIAEELREGIMLLEVESNCVPWWISDPPGPTDGVKQEIKDWPCLHYLWTLRDLGWGAAATYDPLTALGKLEREYAAELGKTCPQGLCAECADDFGKWLYDERVRLWNQLPSMFDLQ